MTLQDHKDELQRCEAALKAHEANEPDIHHPKWGAWWSSRTRQVEWISRKQHIIIMMEYNAQSAV